MIRRELEGALLWLVLDRPEKLNAMKRDFWSELEAALEDARVDPDVRVVAVRGEGRCFSVGGDIEKFDGPPAGGDHRAPAREAIEALLSLEEFPKPTIAAVHGHALGGGCELAMVCDVVVADETARFGTPETAVGLVPGLAILRAPAYIGLHWVKFMLLTGESLTAEQAYAAGLAQAVVPAGEHIAEARRLAARVATRSPQAMAAGKRLLGRDMRERVDEAVETLAMLLASDDLAEGVAAFRERRQPAFKALADPAVVVARER